MRDVTANVTLGCNCGANAPCYYMYVVISNDLSLTGRCTNICRLYNLIFSLD
jgi:hypothetical protein